MKKEFRKEFNKIWKEGNKIYDYIGRIFELTNSNGTSKWEILRIYPSKIGDTATATAKLKCLAHGNFPQYIKLYEKNQEGTIANFGRYIESFEGKDVKFIE